MEASSGQPDGSVAPGEASVGALVATSRSLGRRRTPPRPLALAGTLDARHAPGPPRWPGGIGALAMDLVHAGAQDALELPFEHHALTGAPAAPPARASEPPVRGREPAARAAESPARAAAPAARAAQAPRSAAVRDPEHAGHTGPTGPTALAPALGLAPHGRSDIRTRGPGVPVLTPRHAPPAAPGLPGPGVPAPEPHGPPRSAMPHAQIPGEAAPPPVRPAVAAAAPAGARAPWTAPREARRSSLALPVPVLGRGALEHGTRAQELDGRAWGLPSLPFHAAPATQEPRPAPGAAMTALEGPPALVDRRVPVPGTSFEVQPSPRRDDRPSPTRAAPQEPGARGVNAEAPRSAQPPASDLLSDRVVRELHRRLGAIDAEHRFRSGRIR